MGMIYFIVIQLIGVPCYVYFLEWRNRIMGLSSRSAIFVWILRINLVKYVVILMCNIIIVSVYFFIFLGMLRL